jgi:hypothetical protein
MSVSAVLTAGLKTGQNAFERIFLLGFAFAPDFFLLSASWEPFFLYNFATVLLCWMHIEYRSTGSLTSVKESATASEEVTRRTKDKGDVYSYRAVATSDIYRGLIFLYLVHAVSL